MFLRKRILQPSKKKNGSGSAKTYQNSNLLRRFELFGWKESANFDSFRIERSWKVPARVKGIFSRDEIWYLEFSRMSCSEYGEECGHETNFSAKISLSASKWQVLFRKAVFVFSSGAKRFSKKFRFFFSSVYCTMNHQ